MKRIQSIVVTGLFLITVPALLSYSSLDTSASEETSMHAAHDTGVKTEDAGNTKLKTVISILAVIFSTICALPQVIKTWQTKDTKGLSLLTFLILFTSIGLWLVFGILSGEWAIILANSISMFLVALVLGMKIRYG